ncbi:hypothetical protein TNCV_1061101 [Trichonephila clavipes]|nr:hypothetical protein TNCV_1061101 [Trichonephila clavipes]
MKTSSRFSLNENSSTIVFWDKPGLIRQGNRYSMIKRSVDMLKYPLKRSRKWPVTSHKDHILEAFNTRLKLMSIFRRLQQRRI